MRTIGRTILESLPAIVLAMLASGCGAHGETPSTDSSGPGPMPIVTVARPARLTLTRSIEQPARMEAFEQTPVFAKIAGYVQRINVDIGAHVKKGDVLAARVLNWSNN